MKYLTKAICERVATLAQEVDARVALLPETIEYEPAKFYRFLEGLTEARRAVAALDEALKDAVEEYHRARTETWND